MLIALMVGDVMDFLERALVMVGVTITCVWSGKNGLTASQLV